MRNILLTLIFIFCVTLSYSQLSVTSLDTEYTIDFDNTVSGVNNGQYNGSGFVPVLQQVNLTVWMVYGFAAGGSPVTQNFNDNAAYDPLVAPTDWNIIRWVICLYCWRCFRYYI